ncbi:MAG: hypothetical protein GTO15_11110 [Pseudomonas stutzeri]|nr:hypothetical protein [Stutzerimonas stutzeri]
MQGPFIFSADGTNATIYVFLEDSSTKAGKTGITAATIDIAWWRPLGTVQTVTENDHTNPDDPHQDWYIDEMDATNAPGWYRIDLADAVIASGENFAHVVWKGTGITDDGVLIIINPYPTKPRVTVSDSSPSATQFDTDLPTAADNFYKNRWLEWATGSLAQQITQITGSETVSGKTRLTVTAMTAAPANGDEAEFVP